MNKKNVVLMILDGFGINKSKKGNAVATAKTPNIDYIKKHSLNTKLEASGVYVGLPKGQIGNSEVGHTNIGAGRIVLQDLPRINKSIKDKSFYKNRNLNLAISNCKKNNTNLHIMGLLSDGGVHSHLNHLYAILDLCKKKKFDRVYIHAFLDGRDTFPLGGIQYLTDLEKHCNKIKIGKISTIMGRFYGMDRDKRWRRTQKAYNALVRGKGLKTDNYSSTIQKLYDKKETDEYIRPIIINQTYMPIKNNDSIIFYNFRPDRARQITRSFTEEKFNKFSIKKMNVFFVCMCTYDKRFKNVHIAFPQEKVNNNLGEYLANHGAKQIRIAETEKYAHVTYFMNGEREKPYENEDRILIPSLRNIKTYDLKPEMSAYKIKDALIKSLEKEEYNLLVVNFANTDIIGHTGNLNAAVKAIEHIDKCIGEIRDVIKKTGGVLVITADHGNCEEMYDEVHHFINTRHTTNKVPLMIYGTSYKKIKEGKLCDIAPTILEIMGYIKPKEMTGKSLIS